MNIDQQKKSILSLTDSSSPRKSVAGFHSEEIAHEHQDVWCGARGFDFYLRGTGSIYQERDP